MRSTRVAKLHQASLAPSSAPSGHLLPAGEGLKKRTAPLGAVLEYCILRGDDACETTLNPGFKWEELGAIGLPAARRTCTPGFRSLPVVVIKGQGECFACCRPRQRMRSQYSEACLNTEAVRRFWRVKRFLVPGILLVRAARGRIDSGLGQQPRTNNQKPKAFRPPAHATGREY